MKIISTMMLIVVLTSGCNLEFLYGLKELNDKYCSETNADKRKQLIEAIRKKKSDYPEKGLCGIENVIAERFANG